MNTISRAIRWSAIGELSVKFGQPVFFLLLASLLGPSEYGLVTGVLAILSLAQTVWEGGISKAAIKLESTEYSVLDVCFWIALFIGCVASIFLYLGSDSISHYLFSDSRLSWALKIVACSPLLASFMTVQTAVFLSKMELKVVAFSKIIAVFVPGTIGVICAYFGLGYRSVVYGLVGGSILQVAYIWMVSTWRPGWRFNKRGFVAVWSFARGVIFSGILSWCFMWIDTIFVARNYSQVQVGLYRSGTQLSATAFALLVAPLLPVLYSFFVRNQSQLADDLRFIVSKGSLIFSLLGSTLICFSKPVLDWSLADTKWNGLGYVTSIMAIHHSVSSIVAFNGDAYRAAGRPYLDVISNSILIIVYLAGYNILASCCSFETFVQGRAGLAVFAFFVHLVFLNGALRVIDSRAMGDLLASLLPFFILVICVVAVLFRVKWPNHLMEVGASILVFIAYLAVIFSVPRNRRGLKELRHFVFKRDSLLP